MDLIIGNKYKFVKNTCDLKTYDCIDIGDIGVLIDQDSMDGLCCFVEFKDKGASDWFCKDELEEIVG